MKNRWKAAVSGFLAALMVLGVVLGIPFGFIFPAFAAETLDGDYSSGAVLITKSGNYLIRNGVFSVTVYNAKDVNLIFEDVTIDRRYANDSNRTVEGLYKVATTLGWSSGTSGYCAQTCPLLITGNSEVTVAFRGDNYLYAGTNGGKVSNTDYYSRPSNSSNLGGGFAGVQVDAGSTLTIAASGGTLNVYGAYYVEGDNSENSSYGYKEPAGATHNSLVGGAGIGGGVTYNTTTSNSTAYTAGTPGTIIINGGTINAYGGHQAAGIGGGVNSAATTTSITINGGTVTARGGRWAAGIGDGDSLLANRTNLYAKSYTIEITGGTVTAIGGVSCPGIGATDNLQVEGNPKIISGLKIKLSGGKINARSGYPDKFNPATGTGGAENAAAAIGAGNGTLMEEHSVFILTGAEIVASGFGHYAISENGCEIDKTPNISIEQARLYNGRFPDLTSAADRTFVLYEAIREWIKVSRDDSNEEHEHEFIVFIEQTTNGTTGEKYYYDSDDMILLDADYNVLAWGVDEKTRIGQIFNDHHLTLYVEEGRSTSIKSVTALKYFRSIALTLPDPANHGGIYALRMPVTQVTAKDGVILPSDYIDVTISANDNSNIWSEIAYPCQYNTKLDAVSASFDKVDVYPSAPDDPTDHTVNGMIGTKYEKSVFAYTVYLESDATEAWIYASFLKSSEGVTYSIELINGDEIQVNPTEYEKDGDTYAYVLRRLYITEKETVIRIRKTDTNETEGRTAHSIIYKITFIRKSEYTIQLNPLDKVYDGRAVSPSVASVVDQYGASVEEVTQEDLDSIVYTYTKGTENLDSAPKDAGSYTVSAVIRGTDYNATCTSMAFTISRRTLTVARITNYLTYVTIEGYEELKKDPTIQKPGLILLDGVVGNDDVTVSYSKIFYNNTDIGYGIDKITLEGVTLSGTGKDNYTIADEQKVFGQISYLLNDAIFRKPDGSDTNWDKFYPVDSTDPVTKEDDHSKPDGNGKFTSHTDYVYARTEGEGENGSVYAMDLVFGNMQFTYTEKVWNPTTMEYEEGPNGASFWVGFDGTNNSVTVINRSNRAVGCAVTATIDYLHGIHGSGNRGIGAGVYETNEATDTTDVSGKSLTVDAATPGDETKWGKVGERVYYIRLYGMPALDEGANFTPVGRLNLTFTK